MKDLVTIMLLLTVVQALFVVTHGQKSLHKRALLDSYVDYDSELTDTAVAPGSSSSASPPPPTAKIAGVTSGNSSNTTVSTNATLPAVVSTISFSSFVNAAAFDSTAQTNFKDSIVNTLASYGYNVQVSIDKIATGSVVVSSTTTFLDGSSTGAAEFATALSDTSSVSALFPASTYGTVSVSNVGVTSVKNPSSGAGVTGLSLVAATATTIALAVFVM